MAVLPDDIREAPSFEQAAERLGALLEIDGAVPLPAARQALDDERYARALLATRKNPALLQRMLAMAASPRPSSTRVAAKAAGSVLKWGMAGLEVAEPWVIGRRRAACDSCPFQAPAPDTLVYRGTRVVAGPDARICTICDCLTNTKAAMARERCPERDPANPDLSRWGETWVPPETLPGWPWR